MRKKCTVGKKQIGLGQMKKNNNIILLSLFFLMVSFSIYYTCFRRGSVKRVLENRSQASSQQDHSTSSKTSGQVRLRRSVESQPIGNQGRSSLASSEAILSFAELSGFSPEQRKSVYLNFLDGKGISGVKELLVFFGLNSEKNNLPQWVKDDLEDLLPELYFKSSAGSASQLLDVLAKNQKAPAYLLGEISEKIVDELHPFQALDEIIEDPPDVSPTMYRYLFRRAAQLGGFENVIGKVLNSNDPRLRETGTVYAYRAWLGSDPIKAIDFVYNSEVENPYLLEVAPSIISRFAADEGDFERARQWMTRIDVPERLEAVERHLEILEKNR